MNLLFISGHMQYNVATPEREPLGGSESCLCYLSRALAARGHNVTVMLNLEPGTPDMLMGVRHVPLAYAASKAFFETSQFDAIVTSNAPEASSRFRAFSPKALHISWVHLLLKQIVTGRPQQPANPDFSVYLSQSQRSTFPAAQRAHVIGNGIAPAFENMFSSPEELLAAKENRAAYTSTPFRGLGMLVGLMERTATDTEVDVYSSMRVYQRDDNDFDNLFAHIARTPRMHHHGSLPQPVLAQRLKKTSFLFYPCGYQETFCIAAVEAMASGMKVISSDYGSLNEATLGHAALLPFHEDIGREEYMTGYLALMEKEVALFKSEPTAWAEQRFAGLKDVNRVSTWAARAKQWEDLLATELAAKRG